MLIKECAQITRVLTFNHGMIDYGLSFLNSQIIVNPYGNQILITLRGCLVFVFPSSITLFPSPITQNMWVPWLSSLFGFCFQFLFPSLNSLIFE